MKTIIEIKYGSHLYGTSTEKSDLDIKGIYIPSAKNILLQKVKPVESKTKQKKIGEKNKPEDIDYELYSPQKFLQSLAQGQSFALEMLFAPDSSFLSTPDPAWSEIKKIAPKLFTKKSASFVHYCKHQAYKYCLKGSRLSIAKKVLKVLNDAQEKHKTTAKLFYIYKDLEILANENENLFLTDVYFEICGKKALLNASIKSAFLITQKIISQYGDRAKESEKNKGADWKALSHAVRIGHQAIEFLTTHTITLPRPEAAHLLEIKNGKIEFKKVTEEIEELLIKVEEAAKKSRLPENYDQNIIDDFIIKLYSEQVLEYSR